MRTRVTSLLLTLALVLGLLIPSAALAQSDPAVPVGVDPAALPVVRHVALGDSIATGVSFYFWIVSYPKRYALYLYSDLAALNPWTLVSFSNQAKDGMTSQQLLDLVRTNSTLRAALQRATVITWNIGGNDLRAARTLYKQGLCGPPDNQGCLIAAVNLLNNNLDAIQAELLSLRGGQPTILRTMDIYNPFVAQDRAADTIPGDGKTDLQVFQAYLGLVNAHIQGTICGGNSHAGTRSYCAPVFAAFNGMDGLQDPVNAGMVTLIDRIHPTNYGQRVIADLLRCLRYQPVVPGAPVPGCAVISAEAASEIEFTHQVYLPVIGQ